jgi:hypothetical protein
MYSICKKEFPKCGNSSDRVNQPKDASGRRRLLDPEVEALICTVVERIYLQPERPRISDLLRAVETECRQRGLKGPTFHTLQARLPELDQDDLVRRRFRSCCGPPTLRASRMVFVTTNGTVGGRADRPHSG